ncbi:VanZ family protein [Massilia sp. MB5]|uniref:VanZ family protein n=1 Tax=Massilia sp. MB5 TaxID=2919578 RepID=UPI001F0EE6C4|nr:VanZ family protein [Massilia sp. MB5]UMR31016.1 VanZ family protein [Massilia sp. MB5]
MVFGLAMAGVALGCLLPARWLPLLPHDKLLHFLAFAGLTVLAARLAPGWAELRYWLLGLLVAGWLIEVLQKLVPGRSFCWRDLAANAAGIAVAASAILLLQAL